VKALVDDELVAAAQAGDHQALDLLLRSYLPLVYNVVGRALNGHADVDDVVQETMARAARLLPTLRETDRFRSWLIAIAFREIQVRARARARRASRESSLEVFGDQAAPGPDLAESAVAEVALSGQRREIAEASRWLSDGDRHLLALWWHEAAGQITRSELAQATGISPQHASVRVQRLKDRLQTARVVHRALRTGRGCPRLLSMLQERRGRPGERELLRLSRHVRACEECARTARHLVPPQDLLAGIALLPVPDALAHTLSSVLQAGSHGGAAGLGSLFGAAGTSAAGSGAKTTLILKPALVTGAAITGAGVAITFGLQILPGPAAPAPAPRPPAASAQSPASPGATPVPGVSSRPSAAVAAPVYDGYVMTYFTETPNHDGDDYGLHLAVSRDGLNWSPLNQGKPVVTPAEGTRGLRDPSILRKEDGTFVVLATDAKGPGAEAGSQYVHVWESPDLRTFTYHRLKLHSMDTHALAPKAFWDQARGQYGILYSAEQQGRESIFVDYTPDFRQVSAPQVFFDPGFGVRAAALARGRAGYELYFSDTRDGRIHEARSASPGPRSFDGRVNATSLLPGEAVSSPVVVPENRGERRWLWGDSDSPANGELFLWQGTGDDAWQQASKRLYSQPLNAKLGGVAPITTAEQTALVTRYGTPSWRRIKSYNYSDRLIRHENFQGRVDPYPVEPYTDTEWVLTRGLADPAGVSFRSAVWPSYYLHDTGDGVVLAEDDGTDGFRASATFVQVPGLADHAWTSFRSWSQPTKFLRHSQFKLRVDTLDTDLSRQDATFGVGY
jgi:RNA polymerase sigma factor (sigma-70 family)